MYDSTLPNGYTMRPPTFDDAPQIAALIAAVQEADGDEPNMSAAELINDWVGVNLAEEAVMIIAPDGKLAGYADMINRRFVQVSIYGHVHPAERGRGIGTALMRWGEMWAQERMSRAVPEARVTVQHFIRETNSEARELLEACGYSAVRIHYLMEIRLDQAPALPTWPHGIQVRSFVVGQDEQRVYEAGEEAFSDIWNRPPSTFERWMQPTQAVDFDPTIWFLAEDKATESIAGVCLCNVVDNRGQINVVGVRRPWRRQGLARALLLHAFNLFFDRGVQEVQLSVDAESTTGAPQLYHHVGMLVAKSFVRYEKELRPGVDLSMLATA